MAEREKHGHLKSELKSFLVRQQAEKDKDNRDEFVAEKLYGEQSARTDVQPLMRDLHVARIRATPSDSLPPGVEERISNVEDYLGVSM